MSDSPNFDASVTDPQAHGRIPGRLRENVTDPQAHGRIPERLRENVTDTQAHGQISGRNASVYDLQAHGRIPGRLQESVAGGPDTSGSSAGSKGPFKWEGGTTATYVANVPSQRGRATSPPPT